MFSPVDIQDELIKTRHRHEEVHGALMREVQSALKQGKHADEYVLSRLRNAPKPGKSNINSELLEKDRIFSIDDIKTVCIDYRLRFLDTQYFKMEELPYDAILALKKLEKHLGEDVRHLKIMGAAKFFKLEDRNKDPLLFASIDETNYYLIHKWGKDFSWYNKILAYPFRSVVSLLLTMIIIGLPAVFLIPLLVFHTSKEVQYYQMLFLAAFVVYAIFVTVFGGFTFYKKFSKICWNSPYFN
jgi:hypothetical protein